tara:strand:- start:480 stop:1136 length:657 start_codon:yes stop_codon:yes gene_type:complete
MGRSKDLATGETRFANVSGDTFTGLVNITNTYSSDTTEQLRVSDNTGSKLDFFGHANGTKSIQAYADDGSTFYNLNLQPLGGHVTKPNQPHFFANRHNLATEFRNGTVNYNVIRDTESAWNSTNHQYTIPTTGVYHFGFNNISHTGINTSHQDMRLQYVRGGTTYAMAYAYQTNDSQHEQTNLTVTYYLQANDLVQVYNYGGIVYTGDYNTFSICLLG